MASSDLGTRLKEPGVQVAGFAFVLVLVKIAVAAQIEPTTNEAYHWLYTRHPALGYFNHPPMIGWELWLSTTLFGNGFVGLRLLTILGSSLGIWLTYLTGKRLHDEQTGWLAAFLVGIVPELFQWGSIAYPDAPLVLFWIATFWALAHSLSGDSPRWWIAAGFFLGLAMLSKYHAVFIGVGVLAYLLFSPGHRGWLKRPQPYVAAVVALVTFSPNLAWNATHDWETFRYQGLSHVGFDAEPVDWNHAFPVTEFKHLTPIVAVCAWGVGLWTVFTWRRRTWAERLSASMGMPLILFLTAFLLLGRVRGHWSLPAYPGLLVLAAAWLVKRGGWPLRLNVITVAVMGAGYVVLPIALYCVPRPWLCPYQQLSDAVRARSPGFVLSSNYHVASELGYFLRPTMTSDFAALGDFTQSFREWWRGAEFAGKDAVVVLTAADPEGHVDLIKKHFDRVEAAEGVTVVRFRGREEKFLLIRARGYRPPDAGARSSSEVHRHAHPEERGVVVVVPDARRKDEAGPETHPPSDEP
jgi:hypothetical protein